MSRESAGPPNEEGVVAYTGVYVFGDSLVDAGNALKLAKWYGDLTFSDLPDGAPTAELGYFQGRYSAAEGIVARILQPLRRRGEWPRCAP